jgi:DNA-binding transcriptional regulator/RsmH inhibitor MraZ
MFPLPTYRLSPKNQLTVPKDLRALAAVEAEQAVCALPARAIHDDPAKRFPLITLMTVDEVTRRERQLREQSAQEGKSPFALLNRLNEGLRQLRMDDQRRIVLPTHFVEYLGVERDILFIGTNDTVYVWNPTHYTTWRGESDDAAQLTLDRLLV